MAAAAFLQVIGSLVGGFIADYRCRFVDRTVDDITMVPWMST